MRRPVTCARLGSLPFLLLLGSWSAVPAGCRFDPRIDDGIIACGEGDACPPGLRCVAYKGKSLCCRTDDCGRVDTEPAGDGGDALGAPDAPGDVGQADRPADAPPADASVEAAPDVAPPPPPCEQRACSETVSDQCCPAACGPATDVDCAGCGNGRVESDRAETCDPPGSCPSSCTGVACGRQQLVGSPDDCNVRCMTEPITTCAMGDSCCPATCNSTNDPDCNAVCDNGIQEASETCEPRLECARREGACNSDTDTIRTRTGEVARCMFVCLESPRPCMTGDGLCPSRCTPSTDTDCAGCGNGRVEGAETCDPPVACLELQSRCASDAATVRTGVGDPGSCSFRCQEHPRPCASGDGFCPGGCSAGTDTDCAGCGNGRLEGAETCDPPSTCLQQQMACVGDPATIRTGMGDPGSCSFRCLEMPRGCTSGDGFCPAGCTREMGDRDCRRPSGQACQANGECASGICEDQICCQTKCERCQRCAGPSGTCTAITNAPDPGPCDGNRICDANGMCVPRSALPI